MQIENITGLYHFDDFKVRAQMLLQDDMSHKHFVITLNVNNFKFINQTYGYQKGDFLLKKIAEFFCYEENRCIMACREYSDHFVVLGELQDLSEDEFEYYMHDRILSFSKSIVREFPLFAIHLNVGGYIVEDNHMDISMAFDRAELARRNIKGNYTTSFQMYNDKLRTKSLEDAAMIPLFNRALEEGWLFAYLQPKFEIETGALVGAEALVRMVDENGKMVPPIAFIPKLEEAGLVYQCDLTILEQVLQWIQRWIDMGIQPVPISVNLSRVDFHNEEVKTRIMKLFQKYHVPVEYIEFEVTETAFVDDLDDIVSQVKKLHDAGFRISVDDFGSGYSSLSAVSIMPVDVVKFDRSFVQNCIHSERGEIVISQMAEMFKKLNLSVICEGVETIEEEKRVAACGIKYVQGYVHDKPLACDVFEEKYMIQRKEI